tara:strand:- start:228 stop:446 length:219 start_codon:yes stop_codon:yes gene_type:complete
MKIGDLVKYNDKYVGGVQLANPSEGQFADALGFLVGKNNFFPEAWNINWIVHPTTKESTAYEESLEVISEGR